MAVSTQFPSGPGNPITGTANVQTVAYQILATDAGTWIVIDSSGAVNVTLPATPPNAQFAVGVISIGTGITTVLRNGNNINGAAANLSLSQNEGTIFVTEGTNWFGIEPTANGVTSVGLTMPAIFTVAGSPITSSGTFTVTLNSQTGSGGAGVVLISPIGGGAGVPTFRKITLADSPSVGDVTVATKTVSYPATAADNGTWFIFNSASPVTLTLPAAAPTVPWWVGAINIGAGLLTISPNGLNLNGAGASTTLKTGQGTKVVTDAANYFCAFQALSARTTTSKTTGSLINNGIETGIVLLSKTILIVAVQVSVPARVELYSTSAAATADVGRLITTPIVAGSEHETIMDVNLNNTTGLTWVMSPAAWGSDGKVTPDGNLAYNITNFGGSTGTVTVTWTYIALE